MFQALPEFVKSNAAISTAIAEPDRMAKSNELTTNVNFFMTILL
jgi:hypothetical protein